VCEPSVGLLMCVHWADWFFIVITYNK